MKEYINRDAAENIFACNLDEKDRRVSYQGFCIDAVMRIAELPAEDVIPTEKVKASVDEAIRVLNYINSSGQMKYSDYSELYNIISQIDINTKTT